MRENRKYLNQYEYPSFWESALTIKGSVTPKVLPNVVFCTIYAAIVSVGNIWLHAIELPISPFEYAGVLMGLLLVFRVNAGYDRWWEARKLWGTIVNNSRNLAIVVKNYGDAGNERLIHNT
ncbi:MAG: bestrophin family ion channel, partial [Legionella sp.]